jgi:hypothetical protein
MKLSTLTQRTELREAEQRHDIAASAAVVALVVAIVLMLGGHWMVALAALAAGGFVYWNTAAQVRAAGDRASPIPIARSTDAAEASSHDAMS